MLDTPITAGRVPATRRTPPAGQATDLGTPVPVQRCAERPDPLDDVLLVSPDESSRVAWKANLLRSALMNTVREAHSVASWATLSAARSPDLVLLDAQLLGPDCGGGQVGVRVGPHRIRRDAALSWIGRDRVVVVGPPPPEDGVRRAMWTGSRGYLFGPPSRPAGATPYLDGGNGATARRSVAVPDENGVPQELSHREVEILQLAANGKTNLAIAAALNLSPLTVKSHLGRIGRRLGSGDRARLVYLALRAGAVL